MGYSCAYMQFFSHALPHNTYERSLLKREMFYVGFYVTFFVKLDFELHENRKVEEKIQK